MTDPLFLLHATTFLITFILTVLTERLMIPLLTGKAEQPIYKEGPKWHLKKQGTPTMGGLAFLFAIIISLLCCSVYLFLEGYGNAAASLLICLSYAALNSFIGIIDDLMKLKHKENAGLTPRGKLLLQLIAALMFLGARYLFLGSRPILRFSFGDINLGLWYYPLALIILLGITNCANLTDGIDGLASGVAFGVGVSLYFISSKLFSEASFISSAIIGATVGFLIFNIHPAKIFMGDTGSLLLGSLSVSCAFALENPMIIVFVGGIYVIEGISVILQVLYFKLSKKRLFKMAPLHHHLEKSGWSENKICVGAIILTLLISIPAFAFYIQ